MNDMQRRGRTFAITRPPMLWPRRTKGLRGFPCRKSVKYLPSAWPIWTGCEDCSPPSSLSVDRGTLRRCSSYASQSCNHLIFLIFFQRISAALGELRSLSWFSLTLVCRSIIIQEHASVGTVLCQSSDISETLGRDTRLLVTCSLLLRNPIEGAWRFD